MKLALRTLALPAVLAPSACGGSATAGSQKMGSTNATTSSTSTASSTPVRGQHNDADVAFATGMIPHHAQAIQVADMATQ